MQRHPVLVSSVLSVSLALVTLFGCQSAPSAGEPESGARGAEAAATATTAAPADPGCAADDEMCRVEALGNDRLGELALGMDENAVVAVLGQPDSKSEPWERGADGMWVSDWVWAGDGVTLAMASGTPDAPVAVDGITVTAPSTLATSRGIALGASEADVQKAYVGLSDPAFTQPGELFVAGSVYGGTFFRFADGAVAEIFIGAGAE